MRKRDERPGEGASGTRLVYSTGGDTPAARPAARPQPPAPARAARASGGKGIRLRLEARPGGRAVTLVLGLVGSEAQIAALAKELKSVCGAGGTVKDGVIELQGDHRDSAQAALAERGLRSRI
jgi:translation initiation factor 1